MICEAVIITLSISVCVLSAGNSDTKVSKYDKAKEGNVVQNYSGLFNHSFTINVTEINMNYNNVTQVLSKESGGEENVTSSIPDIFEQTAGLGNSDEPYLTTFDPLIDTGIFDGYNSIRNLSRLPYKHQQSNSGQRNAKIRSNNDSFTAQITTVHERIMQTNVNSISKQDLDQNMKNTPYHIHSDEDRVESLTLERKKILLQHHLQLVPMEDEPLGAMMLKNQRYIISVLVPIGVGMIGAAMIVCTVLTLRKVARKRNTSSPIDDDAVAERSLTPGISSISTETTDKIFLLPGDDEI